MRIANCIFVGAAAITLAACAGGIPTPETTGLPDPASIIIPDPAALPDAKLCAYADELEAAAAKWETWASGWLKLIGKEPVSLKALAAEQVDVEKIAEARGLLCAEPAPVPRP